MRNNGYKTAVIILSIAVVIETIAIINLRRPEEKAKKKIYKPQAVSKPVTVIKGSIAFVIDDWGYNLDNLTALKQIKYPLTLAVLPNLPYSKKISREAKLSAFEVILHLPMQPHEQLRLERNTVMTSMDRETIGNILEDDFKSIVYARGVSNHMGSKATEDERILSIIFPEFKKRRLYFLDSYVSRDSICRQTAEKFDLRFAVRDIFIDNTLDAEYIKGQINKLKKKALAYGNAIGIGHDRKATLEVLKEVMPQLDKEGFKLVFVSDLVR